jgi:pimeloyl-ACP methyl ester carboxylesterase
LVLVHGFGLNAYTWSRCVPELSRTHRVHLVELKGFGLAPKPRDQGYGPEDQAALLYRWILQSQLEDVTLIGHSFGGGVALLTALKARAEGSHRIRRLAIVAGIAYPQPIPRALKILARPVLGPLLLRLLPSRYVIRTALEMAYHPSNPVSESFVEAYAAPLRSAEARFSLSRAAAQLRPPESEALAGGFGGLDLPALLMWGRQDPVVPLWVGERLAGELPRAHLEIIEDCGHMPQEERPEESLRLLSAFLHRTD